MTRAAASLVLVALSSTFTKYVPKSGQRIPQSLSRGWGDQLNWAQTYEEALSLSRSTNKPLMVLFHLDVCPAALKQALAHDDEIQRILDEDFVVLNVIQETVDQNMSPDGKYVPRIMFVGSWQPKVTYVQNVDPGVSYLEPFSKEKDNTENGGDYKTQSVGTDPSMTVRDDIIGRYSNRLYAYEPGDVKLCKCSS
ncbi:anterior gradient protein 2 homolog [Salarias fasciatus]|uniref:anterior gradient protein 2 homolog n=1 Tax=Salarias fasciatus TaxID=181472 RepID=UPI001176AA17|nr:anterior gradient protein 2 homolog [Salarias fasciatus]